MQNKQDSRQTVHHSVLRRLSNLTDFTANGYNQLRELLLSMNFEFSQAFELYSNSTPNLVLNIGSNVVSNSQTGYRHSTPPINKQFPSFTSGTITLPSASGGTILVSPTVSTNPTLSISANAFIKALIECDSQGNLSVSLGNEGATEALATFPGVNPTAFQVGLVIIQTVSGVVQSVTPSRVIQFQGGGGSGSSDGSGVLEPIPGYEWLQFDEFDDTLSSSDSTVTSTSYTNASFDLSKSIFRMACDKSRTVASNSGTALSVNLAPSFTVAIGDIVYATSGSRLGQWRRISAVGSQTSYTLDSAFTGGNASGGDTLMISQAVWTKDLVNFGSVSDKTRARDQWSGNILKVAIDYQDSLTISDDVADFTDTARVVVSASNSGLVSDSGIPLSNLFTAPFVRQAYPAQINDYILSTNTNQQRLFLAFFPNPSNGSVTTGSNLIRYEASFFEDTTLDNGGSLNSAYCNSDGSGTPVNCLAPTVVSTKTQVQLSWSFIPNVNTGQTKGQLTVYLSGQEVPRFVSGATLDAYYKEVQNLSTGIYDTLEFHADLSADQTSIEVVRNLGVIDTNNQNTSAITTLQTINDGIFQSVQSGSKTPLANAQYQAMSGNALSLTAGLWELWGGASFVILLSGTQYNAYDLGWYAANGADSGSTPAALTTIAGLTMLAPTTTGRGKTENLNTFVNGAVGDVYGTYQVPKIYIRLTAPALIYLVPFSASSAFASTAVQVFANAKKVGN